MKARERKEERWSVGEACIMCSILYVLIRRLGVLIANP